MKPLEDLQFKSPGIIEKIGSTLFGIKRPYACIQIEVSSVCFGECMYCPHMTSKESWKSRHMDEATFARIWPLLLRSERAHLQGWGEPLLNPSFFDFAKFASRAGCQVSTTTCGLGMNEGMAEKIIKSGMDIIAFSLAGTDEASNSARKNISFKKVCQNIGILNSAKKNHEAGPEIHLAYLLLADRMKAVSSLPELMERLNVQMTVVSTLDYIAKPSHKQLAFSPWDYDLIRRAEDLLIEAAGKAAKSGRIIYFSLPVTEKRQDSGGCRENIHNCLYVDAEGFISPCVYLNIPGYMQEDQRRIFGNINIKDPIKIWKQEDYKSFRKAVMNGIPEKACSNCPKKYMT